MSAGDPRGFEERPGPDDDRAGLDRTCRYVDGEKFKNGAKTSRAVGFFFFPKLDSIPLSPVYHAGGRAGYGQGCFSWQPERV